MPPRRAADAQIGAEIDPRRPSLYEDAFLDQLLQVVKEALPPGEHGTNLPANSAGEDIGRMEASTHSTSSIWAAAGPLRSQESALHHISSMIARSINADDYWANLGHQVTVDHYAAFVNYCGTQGFSALKTLHLLKFLESFQALVAHGIVDGDADGTTKQGQRELSSHSTLAHPSSAAPSEDRKGDKKEKKEKKEKKKAGKKGKAATPATASPATEAAAPVEVPPASPLPALPPPVKRSLEEVLREKMRDFFTLEVEEGWKWDRFPRQPMEREVSPATTSKGKKASRSEKAKQQQQEQEEEQKRLAAAAALPPENIYLTTEEIPSFTLFFLARGLLQHTALYQYMASHEQADEPRCAFNFRVAPELPFPIRPLSEAVLQVAPEAAAAPAISEVPESKTALNRRISHHANAHRGNAQRGAAAAAAAAQQVPDPAPPPPPVEEKPAKDPLTLMREEQERELAQFSAEHKAAVELEEERARMAQTEKEMELLFENEGTQRAVVDVYGGMESQLTERQLRLLQRIEALEIALGLRPPPPEKPVEAEGQEDSRRRSPGRRKR